MLIGTVIIASTALPQPQITSEIIVDGMYIQAPRSPIVAQNAPVSDLIEEVVLSPYDCSCVKYVRLNSNVEFPPIPDPSYLKPNSPPVVGGLVLLKFSGYPHIGIIKDLRQGGFFMAHQYLSNNKCITEEWKWVDWNSDVEGFYN